MKNEITNTNKPALQSGEQAFVKKSSSSMTRDNTTFMRRRSLLKGLGATPLVITLHSGAAMAASSTGGCVGTQPIEIDQNGCRANDGADHDSFLRVEVDENGKADGYSWGEANKKHPYYEKNEDPDRNQCLVSVDAEGNIHTDSIDPLSFTTNSCWCSFT